MKRGKYTTTRFRWTYFSEAFVAQRQCILKTLSPSHIFFNFPYAFSAHHVSSPYLWATNTQVSISCVPSSSFSPSIFYFSFSFNKHTCRLLLSRWTGSRVCMANSPKKYATLFISFHPSNWMLTNLHNNSRISCLKGKKKQREIQEKKTIYLHTLSSDQENENILINIR